MRVSAGYARFERNLAAGHTVRATILRRWKTSENYLGVEGSVHAMMLGPRVGMFFPVGAEGGGRILFSVDFGLGY